MSGGGLPPLSLSGGHASASTGTNGAGASTTGAFYWKRDTWSDRVSSLAPLAVLGLVAWLAFRKKG